MGDNIQAYNLLEQQKILSSNIAHMISRIRMIFYVLLGMIRVEIEIQ